MRRTLVAVTSIGAAALLAACQSDHLTTSGISPRQRLSAVTLPACTNEEVTKWSKGFFAPSSQTVSSSLSTLIATLTTGSNANQRTAAGFSILSSVSDARRNGNPYSTTEGLGTSFAGGSLVAAVVSCMDVGTIPASFDPFTAVDNGILEVRGNLSTASSALAYTRNGTWTQSSPIYGVEPRTANGWPQTSSQTSGTPRYLIYGFRTTGDFAGETPADLALNAFEVGSLPADFPKDALRVGICEHLVVTDPSNPTQGVAANILIHNDQMIANESPTFCPTQSASASSWLTRVASLFRPSVAFAQNPDDLSRDFIGGGPSGWSPMSWAKVTGTSMNLLYATQPKNTNVNPATIPTFVVHVQSDAGNAVPGVNVTVTVVNNSGLPAGAFVSGTLTVKTNATGDAIFSSVSVNKAGGYRLIASGSLGGVKTNTATSNLFNVKNK